MKLWKKILIIVAAILIVLSAVGGCVYKFYIVPKYIEPALEFVSTALMNSEYQDALSDLANELVRDGILDEYTAKTYLRKSRKYTSIGRNEIGSSNKEISDEELLDDILNDDEDKRDENVLTGTSRTSIGIETVKSDADYPNEEHSGYHTYSEKQDAINKNKEDDYANTDVIEFTTDNTNTNQGLYNKIFSAMKPSERTVFLSVISQVDVTELISLYNMGDKAGVKEHLRSRLSDEQYQKAVDIFYKYAPLLYK